MATTRTRATVFTERENDVLRAIAQRIVTREGTQAKAARVLGTNQPTLSGFINRYHGASYPFATAIAATEGKSVRDLLGWTSESGATPPIYADRDLVVQAVEKLGISRAAVLRLQGVVPKDGATPDAFWWLKKLVTIEEDERGG